MTATIPRLIFRIITWGFNLLYHQFAWMYNFAAWLVSAGQWDNWVRAAGRLALDGPLLDIGCGQGALLKQAIINGIVAVGLDESPQMLHRSQKQLLPGSLNLICGQGQALPFAPGIFRSITATFPASYLFEQSTLLEIRRILAPHGRLIILLTAIGSGNSLHERSIRLAGGLFGFSHLPEAAFQRVLEPLRRAGFNADVSIKDVELSRLYFILAQVDG
ncbi:MAG: class I SAM-dependent methyltransferase [Leptolinea sp.]